MLERLSWKKLVVVLVLFCLPACGLSLFIGHLSWLLVISLLVALCWHSYHLLKLSDWLWLERRLLPPAGKGVWEPIFYGIYQLQQRNRKRRRELVQIIRRFRSGAESLPDAVIIMTAEGNIVWCNRLAEYLLGFRWPEDSGQSIFNLLRYPDFNRYFILADYSVPFTIALNNGAMVEFQIMSYVDDQLLMVARDITEKEKLEKLRGEFFANANHELRTPLTVLQGYLEIMDEQTDSHSANKKALHSMREQVARMDRLIEQLLQLSRIEIAPHVNLNEQINIPAMLNTIKQDVINLSLAKHEIIFDVDKKLQVYGNEEQLRSAISNLIYNAINHTPVGTSIHICWQHIKQGALFSIRDNGPGIASAHLLRLTERFYRVEKSRSRRMGGGSGLGLAIVKHALIHHHSQLNIESQLGKGSVFSFILPSSLVVTTKNGQN
ncbi:phosphate regulon sensor histidine kinase PhoR [Arsenophonus sp. aPb]|uniref:phosphate regulon sensor histidine kinase PhoR n=1 Tax=Arsenophonus sp. aPb TaxID=3041619 RepID=UPI0024694C1A|nr:phosphate regulon sensor histidine kinase PhoR [Arsenophonus sp. aPb]WGL97791.1 phosphate regulon sensor histidine kinase PhoR [Arsenophonus sp. aPb]